MFAIHDSFSTLFREPFGAIRINEGVELSIFAEGTAVYNRAVKLLYFADGVRYEMPMYAIPYIYDERVGELYSCRLHMSDRAGLVWYCFEISEAGGIKYYCGKHGKGFIADEICCSYQITVYKPYELPECYKSGIVYQIFPDRFARGNGLGGLLRIHTHTNIGQSVYVHEDWDDEVNFLPREFEEYYTPCDFFCGDLKGIEENLDYFKKLNITYLYLNPIFASPSNHRYDTSDYMKADGILGGDEAFFSLYNAAERVGINIMLDGVFSHTGADSIYFNKYKHYGKGGAYNSKDSEYFGWYYFGASRDDYKSWWGFPELPEVNEDDDSYREYIGKVIDKWKVSWRLDVADELTDDFISFLRTRAKRVKHDAVIIGEVWEDASDKFSKGARRKYTDGDVLDGVMNYVLRGYICDFLLWKTTAYEFAYNVKSQWENYPDEFMRGTLNILSSHDTPRILSVLCGAAGKNMPASREEQQKVLFVSDELTKGVENVILAMCLQFMLPGVPCIYYGDEQGMQGMADPFCRRPFRVDNDCRIMQFCVKLCELRAQNAAFSGESEIYAYTDNIVAIERYRGKSYVLCVINRSYDNTIVRMNCKAGIYVNVTDNSVYRACNGTLKLMVKPRTATVLKLRETERT